MRKYCCLSRIRAVETPTHVHTHTHSRTHTHTHTHTVNNHTCHNKRLVEDPLNNRAPQTGLLSVWALIQTVSVSLNPLELRRTPYHLRSGWRQAPADRAGARWAVGITTRAQTSVQNPHRHLQYRDETRWVSQPDLAQNFSLKQHFELKHLLSLRFEVNISII